MDRQSPRSRKVRVTGSGQSIHKRGSGLGTGPVGGGQEGRGQKQPTGSPLGGADRPGGQRNGSNGGFRSSGRGGGFGKLLILLLVLIFGGGGTLLSNLSGSPTQSGQSVQQGTNASGNPGQAGTNTSGTSQQTSQGAGINLASLLGNLSGGNVSSGWLTEANTGKLNTKTDPSAREKRVKFLGKGKDTATIMVYMCGTDLESRSGMGTSDLQEMLEADFGENIRLLVYTGGCTGWRNNQISSTTNQIWQIKNGQLLCLENNLGSKSMTEPDTLTGFIRWCTGNYPASRYELIFWDHGGGAISGYGYDQKFPSSGSMGLAGIHRALKNAGTTFDFIGFDACLMATAETALMLTEHADYLIASEETEPGVGWYYTNWLTDFGKNTSMPTIELGKKIADDFVDVCAQKCPGQMTTLSVIDLAELESTVPAALTAFSKAASGMISSQQYQALSRARGNTREFARSSRIDHVDLVHLAKNVNNEASNALAQTLLSTVKYNRTSSNMTNAYGLSIYFPYQNIGKVDKAVASYQQIGMDEEYVRCIQQFASLEVGGQAASGGTSSPLPALLGSLTGSTGTSGSSGGAEIVAQLLGELIGGSGGNIAGLTSQNSGFLSNKGMDEEAMAQYLAQNRFAAENLVWESDENGNKVIRLDEKQWNLVQTLEMNLFYDDGEGYIDLGLDNVFSFNDNGDLLAPDGSTWLAIAEHPVAYYHVSTVDDGENYTITGRVPVLYNGERAELLLSFDHENPYGWIAGVRMIYSEGETETVAKSDLELQEGDVLEFLCDYYSYDGEYQDSYLMGEPLVVGTEELMISNVPLEGKTKATYRFTDIYQQHYWTQAINEDL